MRVCKVGHPLSETNRTPMGACKRCLRLRRSELRALREGKPFCENGHGLAGRNVDRHGNCIECTPPPPPDTWLDWAAVYQALMGKRAGRPLTRYEMLCAIVTVMSRNCWSRKEAVAWLRENTVVDPPQDDAEWLVKEWPRKAGVKPLTLAQAVYYENEPDTRIAEWACEVDDGEAEADDLTTAA